MFDWFALARLLAQLEAPAQQQQGGGAANAAKPGIFGGWNCLLLGLIPLMLVYLMMMSKPQSRDQARNKEMLANLKKNDRVVTAGGIVASVVNVSPESDTITVRIDESNNTKITILKSSIAKVLADDSGNASDS